MQTTFHKVGTDASKVPAANPSPARFKRLALLAATVGIGAWLAGCGGGGGGDSASPAPAPPAPAPGPFVGTHFYAAGIVGSETAGHRLVVADSEVSQGATLLSVPVPASVTMLSTAAYTVDAASPTVTYRGAPVSYFLNAGQLWQLDLSPGKVPTSTRVSSLSDGCQTQMTAPLNAAGLDAWVLVTTAGPDGNCSTLLDNRQVFVRTGSSTATAPTMVPVGTRVEPVYLTGADGALWWMLAVNRAGPTPRLVAYGPSLNVVDVAGGGGIQVLNAQGHAAKAPEGTFVRVDDTLRRIEATAASLSIGSPQLTFTGPSSLTLLEGSAMYFADGSAVYKVEGSAPAALLARPNPNAASTSLLAQTPAVVVLTQQVAGGASAVSAVNKQSGAVQALLQQTGSKNDVWAVRGNRVFYFAGNRGSVGELRSIGVDGTGDSGAFTNLLLVGRVLNSSWVRGEMTDIGGTKALLACQPLPGSGDCRGSTLLQIDLATLALTALGPFPSTTGTVFQVTGSAFENIKGASVEVLSNGAPDSPMRKDLYVFNPGEAGSLKLVNPTTP